MERRPPPSDGLSAYFAGKEHLVLAVALVCTSCTAAMILYGIDSHAFLYFGDAVSHVVRARQFVDSQRPGFHNIGTVWLPLHHLVLLPLVTQDALFYSGLAGMCVGIPSLVATSVLLFSIARSLTGSVAAAYVAGFVFGLNPNVVYIALTPMSEPLFLLLVALAGYALLHWLIDDRIIFLWLCATAVVLATLCRYEGWLLPPFLSLIGIAQGMALRQRAASVRWVQIILVVVLCWIGVALWCIWNLVEYGDALKFARWTYSVALGTAPRNIRHSTVNALLLFGKALFAVFGPVLFLAASGVLLGPTIAGSPRRNLFAVLAFLALPAAFALASILAGFVQIDEWRWNWRYVLTVAPLLAITAGAGSVSLWQKVHSYLPRALFILGMAVTPVLQLVFPSFGVATYQDARRSLSDETQFASALGDRLRGYHPVGEVDLLTGNSQAQRIMMSSGLPLKQFHIIYSADEQDILLPLILSAQYIVIGRATSPESERFVEGWLSRLDEMRLQYDILIDDSHYILLARKGGSPYR